MSWKPRVGRFQFRQDAARKLKLGRLESDAMNTETWIPVCKRLPAVSEPVLTYDEASSTRAIAFLNNGRWLRDYPDPMLRVEVRVTHWQPLPQLPIRDAFEFWWEKWRKWECDRDVVKLRNYTIEKESARLVWDFAIASTQNK